MKYKVSFSYAFPDKVKPKRFQRDVDIAADLEFPFPKQIDEAVIALKAADPEAYKHLKEQQFETYTGVAPAKFQSAFDAQIRKKIDANFVDYARKVARPDFDERQWDKLLALFETRQVAFLKESFAQDLSALVTDTYEKLERLKAKAPKPDESRQLDADQAFLLWCGRRPVRFRKVEDKFYDDHIKQNVSRQFAFDWAVERFKSNRVTTSSVVDMSPAALLNKANGGKAYPTVYRGVQQIAVKVSCDVWTVKLQAHDDVVGKKALELFKKDNKLNAQARDVWLSAAEIKTKTQDFYVMGRWDPESGEAELYHYQDAGAKPALSMLKEYLRWTYSHKEGRFVGPSRDGR
ncbi:hypothetical protein PV762_04980 [Mitsuaria sp. CC2]|uniref:hypothetical protein n=1 Tax=Mitsuaria sp. CC2 TaxID=3029186 RepID=UPI003B8D3024